MTYDLILLMQWNNHLERLLTIELLSHIHISIYPKIHTSHPLQLVTGTDDLKNVATIGSVAMGRIIAQTFEKVGENG